MFYPSPERILAAKDRSEKIQLMLELMTTRSRQGPKWAKALWWCYVEGKEIPEIAEMAGVSERTVYRWLEEGLKAAKSILDNAFQVTSLEDL